VAYKVQSLDEMLALLVALFKSLLPDRNISSRFTPAWKLVKTIAGAITDINANVNNVGEGPDADTARGAALDRFLKHLRARRTQAVARARRRRASRRPGRVRGAVGATSALGDQLVHRASGLLFQVNQSR
jgi:hypothetical protein